MELLLQSGSVHLPELVQLLQVSTGTIRNDLRTLEKQGELIRTHGGAVMGSRPTPQQETGDTDRAQNDRHQKEIRAIAKRAAELVEEGDIIVLAGGPIIDEMAGELVSHKSLTVITNSILIAATLSRNPTQTVILTGGQLRCGRDTLDGHSTVALLRELRVQKAFIGCDGISAERGYTDDDLASSEVKSAVFHSGRKVIVVALAEQLGHSALVSVAQLSEAHHLVTADKAPEVTLNALRVAGVQVSLCGEHITELYADRHRGKRWRIGFANLTEKQEFSVSVRQSIERAAFDDGTIDLVLTDNEADPAVALTNAKGLIEAGVDLAIEYQQHEQTNNVMMHMYRSAHIPVIAIDIPLPGATFFGADNYRAGRIGGEAAASWVNEQWNGKLDYVVCLEQPESGPIPAARIQGQIDALRPVIALTDDRIIHLSTHGDLEGSQLAATQALHDIPRGKTCLFVGINANSALGALAAAEILDYRSYVAVVSQNASARVRRRLLQCDPMLIGAVDYFPQSYGIKVISMAVAILHGRPTPPAVYTDHILITPDNVAQLYPDDMAQVTHLTAPILAAPV